VFDVGNREFARYYTQKLPWYMKKNLLRQTVEPMPPLYDIHADALPEGATRTAADAPSEGVAFAEKSSDGPSVVR
jgi:hypothetical protein